jgi:hypothetical protein
MISSQCSRFYRAVFASSGAVLGLLPLLIAGEAQAGSFTFHSMANTTNTESNASTHFSNIYNGLGAAPSNWHYWTGDNLGYDLAANPMYQAGKGVVVKNGEVAFIGDQQPGLSSSYQAITLSRLRTVGGQQVAQAIPIVDTQAGGRFSSFGSGLAVGMVNGNRTVAFVATERATGETKIFVSEPNGRNIREVASSQTYGEFAPGLSINDRGVVGFTARKDGVINVYKAETPPTSSGSTTVTSPTDCESNVSPAACTIKFQAPSINDAGNVAYSANNGVYVDYDGIISPVLSSSSKFYKGSYSEANINNDDWVSAFAIAVPSETPFGGALAQVIHAGNGSQGEMVAGTYYNDSDVAWWTSHYYLGTSSINDNGDVAFMSQPYIQAKGIFTGQHSINDKVISLGDSLLGSTVTDLTMDREGLSKDGEISFWAKLANGFEGVFLAVSNEVGVSQFNPWLPNCPVQNMGSMNFCGVTSGNWFDPPTAYGFDYEMNSASLFTSILDLPSSFENPFTVSVADKIIGIFSSGDSLNFGDHANLLGDLLMTDSNGNKGVQKFTVRTGDVIDPTNPMALPIKLAFNTELADFSLFALDPTNLPTEGTDGSGGTSTGGTDGSDGTSKDVPEPATILGLLTIGTFFIGSKRR